MPETKQPTQPQGKSVLSGKRDLEGSAEDKLRHMGEKMKAEQEQEKKPSPSQPRQA